MKYMAISQIHVHSFHIESAAIAEKRARRRQRFVVLRREHKQHYRMAKADTDKSKAAQEQALSVQLSSAACAVQQLCSNALPRAAPRSWHAESWQHSCIHLIDSLLWEKGSNIQTIALVLTTNPVLQHSSSRAPECA